MTKYTRFTGSASLANTGQWIRNAGIFEILDRKVKIKQKIIKYTPMEKIKMALVNILAGGAGVADINNRLRVDKALQVLFGLKECAEQSTISEMLNACTAENIQEMREALKIIYQKESSAYRHCYNKKYQILDIDMSALLAGKQAEGASKGYFSGKENRRGRQLGRVMASLYDEIVSEILYAGTVQLEKSLPELVGMAEKVLDLDEQRRKGTIVRMDAGGGTDSNINFLLNQYYLLITKVKNWQRTNKLVKSVCDWQVIPQLANHEAGWVVEPHAYDQPTRQLAIRWPNEDKKGEWHYCVMVFNLSDAAIFELARLPIPKTYSDAQLIATLVDAYDLRGGAAETSFRNSKQGICVTKRNKKSFQGQEMLILLAQLVYNITVWVKAKLAKHFPTMASFGSLRMIRDAFHIPGKIQFDENGKIIAITLNKFHKLSRAFFDSWPSFCTDSDLRLILGKV